MKESFEFELYFSAVENICLTSIANCEYCYSLETRKQYNIIHGWNGNDELVYVDEYDCASSRHFVYSCVVDVLRNPSLAKQSSSFIIDFIKSNLKL